MKFPQSFIDATIRQVRENGPLIWDELTPSHRDVLRDAKKAGTVVVDTDPETHELSVWWAGPKLMDGKHGRGSGRTYQAMLAAPERALFVVGTEKDRVKAEKIRNEHFAGKALELVTYPPPPRRDDIAAREAVSRFSSDLSTRAEIEKREIVCDHSYKPSPAEQLNYMYADKAVTGRPMPGDDPADWKWLQDEPPKVPSWMYDCTMPRDVTGVYW